MGDSDLFHSSTLVFAKQGIFKRWKERWASVEASQATGLQLSVYEEEGLAMPLRIYPLAGATLEIGRGGADERGLFGLRLVWEGKELSFGAKTEAERDEWVAALRTAVDVLHEVDEQSQAEASPRDATVASASAAADDVRSSGKKSNSGKKKKGGVAKEEEEEEEVVVVEETGEVAAVSPRSSSSKGGASGKKKKGKAKGKAAKYRQFGGTGALVRGRRQAGLQCLCKSVDWLSEGGRREVVVDGRPGYVSVVGRSTVNRLDASKRLHEAQAKGKHVDGWPVLVAQGHLGSLVTFGAADGHAASPNNVAGLDRCGRNERVVVAHVAGEPQVGQHGSNGATGSVEGHDALLVGCVGEQEDVVPFDVAV
eukprot:CAMPEP_0170736798 /NCGR_PEP_ID=MMETSP0437-20130122/3798_1 /TAXON_ID=0 /ORGANISM="Sexangularia sp." /LENGTH=366 /DNA_ID=CAMNT_0011075167 /DNA_START=36 /DNA_END=1137 /DNA_ORIENTATION=+